MPRNKVKDNSSFNRRNVPPLLHVAAHSRNNQGRELQSGTTTNTTDDCVSYINEVRSPEERLSRILHWALMIAQDTESIMAKHGNYNDTTSSTLEMALQVAEETESAIANLNGPPTNSSTDCVLGSIIEVNEELER